MPISSYSTLSNWDHYQGPKSTSTSNTPYTTDSPGQLPQKELGRDKTFFNASSLKQITIPQSRNEKHLISRKKDPLFMDISATSTDNESIDVERDTDTETAVASSKTTAASSIFASREIIDLCTPSPPPLDTVSLFGATPSPKSSTMALSPLPQQTKQTHKRDKERFDPESYYGHGTGTGVFLSHVFRPPLPRDTTSAHYLKPHPRVLERITRFTSPSILFEDLPSSPPSSRAYSKPSLKSKSHASSVTARSASSASKTYTAPKYTNLEDALNASTTHNTSDDYLEYMDESRHTSPFVSRKKKRKLLHGDNLPSKKAKLNTSIASVSSNNRSASATSEPKPTKKPPHSYSLGMHRDFFSTGSKDAPKSSEDTHLLPNSSSKLKHRERQILLIRNLNTRHIEMKNKRRVELGIVDAKRGLPAGLNSCSTGFRSISSKGKDMTSSAHAKPGWAEHMFASITTPPITVEYWIVQGDEELFGVRDGSECEDNLLDQDLSEVIDVHAIPSYNSTEPSFSYGASMNSEISGKTALPPEPSISSRPSPKRKHGDPSIPSTQPVQTSRHASDSGRTPNSSPLKNIKSKKKSSSTTTNSADARNPYPSPATPASLSTSYTHVSTSSSSPNSGTNPFSLPISTPLWQPSSSAQPLRKSLSHPEPRYISCEDQSLAQSHPLVNQEDPKSLNVPGPSKKSLGKRKATENSGVLHVKRGRPVNPRPSTMPAISTTQTQYPGHATQTHSQDALGAQNRYDTQGVVSTSYTNQREALDPGSLEVPANADYQVEAVGTEVAKSQTFTAPATLTPSWDIHAHARHLIQPHSIFHDAGSSNSSITSTQLQTETPGLTSPAVLDAHLVDTNLDSRVDGGLSIRDRDFYEMDSHWDDPNWVIEKFLVLQKHNPDQVKAIMETLEQQTIGGNPPEAQSNGYANSYDSSLSAVSGSPRVATQYQTAHDAGAEDDRRDITAGEWLDPSMSTGDSDPRDGIVGIGGVSSDTGSNLFAGTGSGSEAASELLGQDYPLMPMTQESTATTINPSVLFSDNTSSGIQPSLVSAMPDQEEVYYTGDSLPPRGKKRVISVLPKARKQRRPDSRFIATSGSPILSQNSALSLVLEYGSNSNSEDDREDVSVADPVHTSAPRVSSSIAVLHSSTASTGARRQRSNLIVNHEADGIYVDSESELQADDEQERLLMRFSSFGTQSLQLKARSSVAKFASTNIHDEDDRSTTLRIPRSRVHGSMDMSGPVESHDGQSTVEQSKAKGQKKKKGSRARESWPQGSSENYCHQCRTRSAKLSMRCASETCNVQYCVRCITKRYADVLTFDSNRKDFVCFRCTQTCCCDICCRKRGETYVSTKPPRKTAQKTTTSSIPTVITSNNRDEFDSPKTVTERRQKRKSAKGKERNLDLDLKLKDPEHGASLVNLLEPKVASERKRIVRGRKKLEPETTTDIDTVDEYGKEVAEFDSSHKHDWPEGTLEYYCHQCRRKSFRLFMECAFEGCHIKYCVKCITSRYANIISFDSTREDFFCFRCKDACTCDICCRRRGETYVSVRTSASIADHMGSHLPIEKTTTKLPPLIIDTQVSQPVVYWGAVYDRAGEVIAKAYVDSVENDKVIFARPLPPKPRIFVGDVQPEWGLGTKIKVRSIEDPEDIRDKDAIIDNSDTSLDQSPAARQRKRKKLFYVGKPPPPSSALYAPASGTTIFPVGDVPRPIDVDEFGSQDESIPADCSANDSVFACYALKKPFNKTDSAEGNETHGPDTYAQVSPAEDDARLPHEFKQAHNITREAEWMQPDVNKDSGMNVEDIQVFSTDVNDKAAIDMDPELNLDPGNAEAAMDSPLGPPVEQTVSYSISESFGNFSEVSAFQVDVPPVEDNVILIEDLSGLSDIQSSTEVVTEDRVSPISNLSSYPHERFYTETILGSSESSNDDLSIIDVQSDVTPPIQHYETPMDMGSPLTDINDEED